MPANTSISVSWETKRRLEANLSRPSRGMASVNDFDSLSKRCVELLNENKGLQANWRDLIDANDALRRENHRLKEENDIAKMTRFSSL